MSLLRSHQPRKSMAPLKFGLWPDECIQRAFVEGANWWEYAQNDHTMWPSDQEIAEQEAIRRYGDPGAARHGYGCEHDGDPMTEWCDACHRIAKEHENETQ